VVKLVGMRKKMKQKLMMHVTLRIMMVSSR